VTSEVPAHLPLSGVRVLSLAERYPGPYATMLLAELGAEVTMLERPQGGDPTRRFGGHFLALCRNKRSVAVDLKSDLGRRAFWELAGESDILIEGFKPGTMARLGFDADTVRDRLPDLVYVSISSFGQTGPMAPRGGHDITMQGMAGFVDTETHKPAPLPLADLSSAMFAAFTAVCALLRRQRGASGTTIDVSMLDCLLSWAGTVLTSEVNDLDPAPYPPRDPGYGVFETSDGGLITFGLDGEDHQWSALCRALELPEYADLVTVEREERAAAITPRLREAVRAVPWPELDARLSRGGVGYGPVHSGTQALHEDQVRARGVLVEVPGTPWRVIRQPVLFDGRSGEVHGPAPRLGQQTPDVLTSLGVGPQEQTRLARAGDIAINPKEEIPC
jgi:crotonobetainyl-CoA:carnitine CoA-transferase CaiB-like acyl-CoA transferase